MKFDIQDLHVMPLSSCQFRENIWREGQT